MHIQDLREEGEVMKRQKQEGSRCSNQEKPNKNGQKSSNKYNTWLVVEFSKWIKRFKMKSASCILP
jgi:hypothetical protein